ncbi:MAG: DUF3800 domain-containing protein [Candidatus Binatia bacterium]
MRVIYSDEAGIGDERVEPITVVAAVIVHPDDQWSGISEAIEQILHDLVPAEKHATFEFKAGRLFSRIVKNEKLVRRFLRIIGDYKLPVAVGAVDRAALRGWARRELRKTLSATEVQQVAFMACARVVEEIFKRIFPKEKALWIADETRAKIPMKASLGWYQKKAINPQADVRRFEHIVDTVYFGNSHESRGIQLADFCNFLVKRHLMGKTSTERFYELIEDRTVILPWDEP